METYKMLWLNKNKLTFIEFFTDIWLIALVSPFNSTIPVWLTVAEWLYRKSG